MQLRYNYRLDPTPSQRAALARAFGCARVVFNDGLRARQSAHAAGLPYLSDGQLSKQVITHAKTTPRTGVAGRGVSGGNATGRCRPEHRLPQLLPLAVRCPRGAAGGAAKVSVRKDNRQAIRFTANARFRVLDNGQLRLPKIGDLRVRWSRDLPTPPSSVTVVKDAADRYFASFVVHVTDTPLPPVDPDVGIDLGLTHFAVLSDGTKVIAPRFLRNAARRLRRLQKAVARKPAGLGQPPQGRGQGRPSTRAGGGCASGLSSQAVDRDHPRQPSGVCGRPRGAGAGADPVGQVGARRRLVGVRVDVGVQGHPLRAQVRTGGPVVSLHSYVLGLRHGQGEDPIARSVLDLPVWCGTRSGRQRRPQRVGRRTGGQPKRPWSARKTGIRAGSARRNGNPPERRAIHTQRDGNPRSPRRGERQLVRRSTAVAIRSSVAVRAIRTCRSPVGP